MKKVLLMNPSLSTLNMGDKIICEAAKKQLQGVLEDAFQVEISTHLPVSVNYAKLLKASVFDYSFVLGTNLLMGNLMGRFKQWNINPIIASILPQTTLVGAGWWQYNNEPNWYTKKIYQSILGGGLQPFCT